MRGAPGRAVPAAGAKRRGEPRGAAGAPPTRGVRRALLGAGLLIAAAALQSGEREGACEALAIVDVADGGRLGSWPLRRGETVGYAYIHSAEGLPAEELLALEPDGQLHLVGSRSPQHGAGHLPAARLTPSRERPGWQEARARPGPALTPFAMFTDDRERGDPRLLWRGQSVALAALRPRRHVEWRVERLCR